MDHLLHPNDSEAAVAKCKLKVSLLRRTQRRRGIQPEPKPRVQGFSEGGVEGVEVDQGIRGHSVEGQRPSRMVQVHRHPVPAAGGGDGDDLHLVAVKDGVADIVAALQAPGLVVPSEPAVAALAFPSDSSVTHRDQNPAGPLHLPVTATGKAVATQQLAPFEPLGMIGIRLLLVHRHLLVVVGQHEFSADRVRVHFKFTEI